MALKLAGEEAGIQENVEVVRYYPGFQYSGDLETGSHTISVTSRPAIGEAQYSTSLTLPKPDDARLEVKRIAARLSVNIVGLGTAGHVYCSVRVDEDDADHELFNLDWESAGSKLAAVDTHQDNKAAIFNLLGDGQAHTFYFLFWADVADQATIDAVELWEAAGSSATGWGQVVFDMAHTGIMNFTARTRAIGTGTNRMMVTDPTDLTKKFFCYQGGTDDHITTDKLILAPGSICFKMNTAVSTDIACIAEILIYLRSEQ